MTRVSSVKTTILNIRAMKVEMAKKKRIMSYGRMIIGMLITSIGIRWNNILELLCFNGMQ